MPVGIQAVAVTDAQKNPTAVAVTVGEATSSVKGIFQQQAKATANLVAASRGTLW